MGNILERLWKGGSEIALAWDSGGVYLPIDIVIEILSRATVTDILRCKCVCKQWYSMISDRGFVDKQIGMNRKYHPLTQSLDAKFEFLNSCDGLVLERTKQLPQEYRIRNPELKQVLALPQPPNKSFNIFICFSTFTWNYRVISFYSKTSADTEKIGCEVLDLLDFGDSGDEGEDEDEDLQYTDESEDEDLNVGGIGDEGEDLNAEGSGNESEDEELLMKWRTLKVSKFSKYVERSQKFGDSIIMDGIYHHLMWGFGFEIHGIISIDLNWITEEVEDLDSFTTCVAVPKSFFTDWKGVKIFCWNGKLSVGGVVDKEFHVWILEDYEDEKWADNKIVVPLTFLEEDPTLNYKEDYLSPYQHGHGKLWFQVSEDKVLVYCIKSQKVESTICAPPGEKIRSFYASTLNTLQGMEKLS